jgi:hypothetical protein
MGNNTRITITQEMVVVGKAAGTGSTIITGQNPGSATGVGKEILKFQTYNQNQNNILMGNNTRITITHVSQSPRIPTNRVSGGKYVKAAEPWGEMVVVGKAAGTGSTIITGQNREPSHANARDKRHTRGRSRIEQNTRTMTDSRDGLICSRPSWVVLVVGSMSRLPSLGGRWLLLGRRLGRGYHHNTCIPITSNSN